MTAFVAAQPLMYASGRDRVAVGAGFSLRMARPGSALARVPQPRPARRRRRGLTGTTWPALRSEAQQRSVVGVCCAGGCHALPETAGTGLADLLAVYFRVENLDGGLLTSRKTLAVEVCFV